MIRRKGSVWIEFIFSLATLVGFLTFYFSIKHQLFMDESQVLKTRQALTQQRSLVRQAMTAPLAQLRIDSRFNITSEMNQTQLRLKDEGPLGPVTIRRN